MVLLKKLPALVCCLPACLTACHLIASASDATMLLTTLPCSQPASQQQQGDKTEEQ
jgi:hypothetical protein